jgi:hypothetical protein
VLLFQAVSCGPPKLLECAASRFTKRSGELILHTEVVCLPKAVLLGVEFA